MRKVQPYGNRILVQPTIEPVKLGQGDDWHEGVMRDGTVVAVGMGYMGRNEDKYIEIPLKIGDLVYYYDDGSLPKFQDEDNEDVVYLLLDASFVQAVVPG